ncbi:MAG: helix-turn-helix domain-containing protein [Gammaproteobacteria bacterium]|nr:helix-turn-helix domain-containing protein [Gammaproteobacteria bacterium]
MDFYSLSDNAIVEELGQRLRALRLRKNLTQQALADATMLSVNSIKALEAGRGKLANFVVVLRELDALEQLDSFIPDTSISPMQLAKMKGKMRERASGYRGKPQTKDESDW